MTKDLRGKLSTIWKTADPWHMTSLGRGFYEFSFDSYEEMWMVWASETTDMNLGILWLSQWKKDFSIHTQRQTHAQVMAYESASAPNLTQVLK